MSTVEDIARDVIAAVDSDAGYLLASRWVAKRYQQLCSRARFRHLRKVGQLVIHAAIRDGIVVATQGSDTVTTTDATTIAAWRAHEAEIPKRWFRARTNWYEISDVQIGTVTASLRLTTPFVESPPIPPASGNFGYAIAERYVSLDPQVRWVSDSMLLQPRSVSLQHMPLGELDITYPRRPILSGYGPVWWTEVGVDDDGNKKVEFYPYSTTDNMVHYVFWAVPPLLGEKDQIPHEIDPYVLREGALIDAMRYNASRAANAGNAEGAAFWSNSYRAQSTAWERNILEAIRNDKGIDDIGLILRTNREVRPRDVVSAHDEIYARGQRP